MPDETGLKADDLERAGLIVVDVQEAFMTGTMAEERLPAIESLIDAARAGGLPIIYTRSVRRPDGRDAIQTVHNLVPSGFRGKEPSCLSGTSDVKYSGRIEPRPEEYEVEKIRYDAFHGTPLEYYLDAEDIDTLLLCGGNTNVCVDSTARSAFERGYDLILVEDCCLSFSQHLHDAAVENFELTLGVVTDLICIDRLLGTNS